MKHLDSTVQGTTVEQWLEQTRHMPTEEFIATTGRFATPTPEELRRAWEAEQAAANELWEEVDALRSGA